MISSKLYSGYRVLFIAAILFIPILITGCKSDSTSPTAYNNTTGSTTTPPANEVWMQNTSFNPKTKTISAGTEITWINKDSFNHTVTSGTPGNPDGLFTSSTIGPGGTYKHTFSNTGTFNYYCSIHQDIMTGTIVVQ